MNKSMQKLPILKAGDCVEIIAPASRCSDNQLAEIKELLGSWQLNCIIEKDIFGADLLCANTDEVRFKALKKALKRTSSVLAHNKSAPKISFSIIQFNCQDPNNSLISAN